MDYSPPGSSVHGISQARVLEWVAISFSRGSSFADPWMEPASPAWQVGSLPLTHLRSLCYFLLHSKMNQPYICMYPLPFGLPSHSGHHSALFWTESGRLNQLAVGEPSWKVGRSLGETPSSWDGHAVALYRGVRQ